MANEGCNSCACLAGLVLSFIACFILLVIALVHKAAFKNCKRSFRTLHVFSAHQQHQNTEEWNCFQTDNKRKYKNLHTVFWLCQPKTLTDDICNGSGVIVLTDKQTHKRTLLKQYHFHRVGCKYSAEASPLSGRYLGGLVPGHLLQVKIFLLIFNVKKLCYYFNTFENVQLKCTPGPLFRFLNAPLPTATMWVDWKYNHHHHHHPHHHHPCHHTLI